MTGEPHWKVENGCIEVVRGRSRVSKEQFGSAEWATPGKAVDSGKQTAPPYVMVLHNGFWYRIKWRWPEAGTAAASTHPSSSRAR